MLDVECYVNYFLIYFKAHNGKGKYFEMYDGHPLDKKGVLFILKKFEIITFNGRHYDLPMISLALSNTTTEKLKEASDDIIKNELKFWQFYKKYGLFEPNWRHIDLIEPAPSVNTGLKIYGGRMHSKRMQDLPIEEDEFISPEDRSELVKYCRNDLDTTEDLVNNIDDRLQLRREMSEKYGIDLMSKSDAQIAEAVIKSEVEKITGDPVSRNKVTKQVFKYSPPDFIKFSTKPLQGLFEKICKTEYTAETNGKYTTEEGEKDYIITIGDTTYKVGIGGLHSQESEVYHKSDKNVRLIDADVASYYPNLILQLGMYPPSIGEKFLTVFENITKTRLEAKKNKNTSVANSMKIMINGTFGKLGSVYSIFYAPKLLLQTTITGQLSLLMLIEMMERCNIPVVSANTDGIVMKCPRDKEENLKKIVSAWEKHTGFDMEYTYYDGIYNRDVNTYVAIKEDGGHKSKGAFAPSGLMKNPTNEICSEALIAYLKDGTPFEDTLRACKDIRKFISVRKVKGGAIKDDQYLGKAIRWYYAKGVEGTINYKSNGNTVPRSEGAKPCMELPDDFPDDIDYDWYLRECNDFLMDVGLVRRPHPEKIPRKNCKAWLKYLENGDIIPDPDNEGKYIWTW